MLMRVFQSRRNVALHAVKVIIPPRIAQRLEDKKILNEMRCGQNIENARNRMLLQKEKRKVKEKEVRREKAKVRAKAKKGTRMTQSRMLEQQST